MRESIGTAFLLNFIVIFIVFIMVFLAATLSYYKAFRMWCVSQGYLKNDPYAFEDIDADYNEMEYGLDKDDNDISDPEYQQRDLYLIPDESIGLRTTEEDEDDEDY